MKRRQDPKIKLTVYVSRIVAEQLDFACKDRTKNKSKLTETALSELLNPKAEDQLDSAMPRRFDRLTREVGVINRHQQIVIESLGLFIRNYLITSPLPPPSEQQAAQALGHQRFQRFIEQLGRRLASTTTFANEITEHLASHSPKPDALIPDGAKPSAIDPALKT
jgi:fructosamine-3-kinase